MKLGGSGILPCYVGLFTRDFIPMMGTDAPAIRTSLDWILDKPLLRHLTQFFLFGGYRNHLIDILDAIPDPDPGLAPPKRARDAISTVDS